MNDLNFSPEKITAEISLFNPIIPLAIYPKTRNLDKKLNISNLSTDYSLKDDSTNFRNNNNLFTLNSFELNKNNQEKSQDDLIGKKPVPLVSKRSSFSLCKNEQGKFTDEKSEIGFLTSLKFKLKNFSNNNLNKFENFGEQNIQIKNNLLANLDNENYLNNFNNFSFSKNEKIYNISNITNICINFDQNNFNNFQNNKKNIFSKPNKKENKIDKFLFNICDIFVCRNKIKRLESGLLDEFNIELIEPLYKNNFKNLSAQTSKTIPKNSNLEKNLNLVENSIFKIEEEKIKSEISTKTNEFITGLLDIQNKYLTKPSGYISKKSVLNCSNIINKINHLIDEMMKNNSTLKLKLEKTQISTNSLEKYSKETIEKDENSDILQNDENKKLLKIKKEKIYNIKKINNENLNENDNVSCLSDKDEDEFLDKKENEILEKFPLNENGEIYKCDHCECFFSTGQALGGHMSRKHPNLSIKYKMKKMVRDRRENQRNVLNNAKRELLQRYNFDYEEMINNKIKKHILKSFIKDHMMEYKLLVKKSKKEKSLRNFDIKI